MSTATKYLIKRFGLLALLTIIFVMMVYDAYAENLKPIIRLEGSWKFSVGDDLNWAAPNFNDKGWDLVGVPNNWENNGYQDYNGFAWYRKKFSLSSNNTNEEYLFLILGHIDDVDEVYVNGHLVGASGTFPPIMKTAYQELRKYPLSADILNPNGENVIAVRVYDEYMDGGIYSGPVGIFYDSDNALLTVNLSGYWDFETEKNTSKQETEIYGAAPGELFVPANWESQGFPNYDGRGIYNHQFRITSTMDVNNVFLVLGYIDDIDEVFINGTKIGSVYTIKKKESNTGWEYRVFRAYKLPPNLIVRNGLNTLTVRVIDTGGLGGIYEGPVGLTTEANLKILKDRNVPEVQSFWDFINEFFFN